MSPNLTATTARLREIDEKLPFSYEEVENEEQAELLDEYIGMSEEIVSVLEEAMRKAEAGERLANLLDERARYWSLENHECLKWNQEQQHPEKWSAYCGYELEHGIEGSNIHKELSEALATYNEATK